MSAIKVSDLPLNGLKILQKNHVKDDRGFLMRIFSSEELSKAGWNHPIAQVNHTLTIQKGTIRGMHYQRPPSSEMKLISCIRGKVWDVAVDIRNDSPTFLKWHAEILSEDNGRALLIPEGFAHGFQTLTQNTELVYCHTASYVPGHEGGLNPQDPTLAIHWPLPISKASLRDKNFQFIGEYFEGIVL